MIMRQRPSFSGRSVAGLVLERDPQAHPVAGDRTVLDRDVLAQHLGHPKVADALPGRLDRVARSRLPRLAAHTDDLGDPIDAVGHYAAPSDRLTLRLHSLTGAPRCQHGMMPR